MKTIDPLTLKKRLDTNDQPLPLLLDVREPHETERCAIENSVLIPMGEVQSRLNELDSSREIVVICHHGMRSMQVAVLLESAGFENIINLNGGIDAWSCQVDPKLPRY